MTGWRPMRVPRLGVLPVAVPGPLGSDCPGGALPSVHHVWLSGGVCARWRCQRGVACWPVAIVGAVGGAWPPRSPRCVCPGCPGAYDAPRTVEPTLPARATSAAGGRCCHLPVARLGTSAFGGGRPGAALSAVLSQSSIFGQNPKIWSHKFNNLQTPKLSKKQLCDRTPRVASVASTAG